MNIKYLNFIHSTSSGQEFQISNSCLRQYGFTFIEAILYIALIGIVMSAIIPFSLNIITGGAKSSIQQEVSSQARFVSEKIKYEIRNADDIDTLNSNFGSNFALNPSHKLSLNYPSPDNPTVISVSSGKVQLKKGSGNAVDLNSADTKVTDLTFTNNSSADNKTKNLTFTLSLESNYAGQRQEYKFSENLRTSVEIRSN